jgi:hypothetical protein
MGCRGEHRWHCGHAARQDHFSRLNDASDEECFVDVVGRRFERRIEIAFEEQRFSEVRRGEEAVWRVTERGARPGQRLVVNRVVVHPTPSFPRRRLQRPGTGRLPPRSNPPVQAFEAEAEAGCGWW